ncbi:MAG: phosphatase PAP2 family protein [Planctomycetes bacterium]|nr:phosphatase PAP2 family protein [Planctomycetota bacterium]
MANPADTQLEPGRSLPSRRLLMAALIYALVSIALLLGVVSLDNAITRLFWQVHWPTWTVACEDFLSSWSVGIAVGAALLAAVWHDWRARRNRPSAVLHLLIVLLAQAVLIQALKYGIGRARPCDVAVNAWVFVGPNSQYNGFPSGHFTAVAACALVLLRFNRPIGLFLLLWAALTAWARMFSDAHFASDLVAGLLIACAVERFVAARAAVQGSSHPRRRTVALGRGCHWRGHLRFGHCRRQGHQCDPTGWHVHDGAAADRCCGRPLRAWHGANADSRRNAGVC